MRALISSSDSADCRRDIQLFGVPVSEKKVCLHGCVGNDDLRMSGGGFAPTVRFSHLRTILL